MANVQGTFYSATTQRRGVTPVSPPNAVDEPVDPVSPPIGSHPPVTIGTPANGLSIVPSSQVLSIGLASSGVTGALSGTDWNTFNGKIGGTIAAGQVAFGTGANTVGGDSGLVWDNTNKRLGVNRTPTGIFDVNLLLTTDLFSIYNSTTRRFLVRGDGLVRWGSNTDSGNSRGLLSWDTDLAIVSGEVNLALRTAGSNRIYLTNTANVGINTTSPTNTLDVNGTARIRTINNLGTAATSVLVPSATGVVSLRTLTEFRGDLGATTLGANLFTIPNPSAITFPRFNADNTVSALSASDFRTAIGAVPTTITLTINGVAQDLSADRSWTIPTHDAVTLGTANGLSLVGQALSLGLASSGVTGALSGTDWNTFNGKQNAISGTQTEGFVATIVGGVPTWATPSLVVDTNKVSYNAADSKTASERLQARVNIGSTSSTPQVITTAGAINDLAVTSNHLVFTGASVVLSGIVAGLDGEEFTILNASGTNLELLSQSALSVANNRFASGVIVPNLSIVRIKYRTTTSRWVLENVGINDGRYLRKDTRDGISISQGGSLGVVFFRNLIDNIVLDIQNDAGTRTAYWQSNGRIIGTGFQMSGNANTILGSNSGTTGVLQVRSKFDGSNTKIFNCLNNAGTEIFSVRGTEGNRGIRSLFSDGLTNRSELYLNYSQTVATTGTINDLAINTDCKLLILTGADDLTGVVPVDNTRLLRIEARSASRIIRHESASSTAANRFSIGSDLTINAGEVYQFIYTDSRWRRVL